MSSTESTVTRAAASSIASGMPSRRSQISATTGAFSGVRVNDGTTEVARSTNRRTAAADAISANRSDAGWACGSPRCSTRTTPREGTWKMVSPSIPRASRLVARIVTPGQWVTIRYATSVAASIDVLAVVEQEQELLVAEDVDQRIGRARPGVFVPADGAQHFERDEVWVARRGQLGQPDAVPESRRDARRHLEHEPRLAGAAHADERDQAVDSAQAFDLVESRARGRRTTSSGSGGCSRRPRNAVAGSPG